jgi:hypothetical protein
VRPCVGPLANITLQKESQQKSERFCFENPNLTVVELFRLFQSYFLKKYWKTTKNGLQKSFEFFQNRCNFSFSRPKTDVCDFCVESEKTLVSNPNDKCLLKYKVHERKAKAHDELKKGLHIKMQK